MLTNITRVLDDNPLAITRTHIDDLETLSKKLPTVIGDQDFKQVSSGRRFISFRTAFFNNYDFEAIQEAARMGDTVNRTGSRITTWKLLLGVLPIQRNKDLWMS